MRELALFAGAGGGVLGGHLLGWRCVCAVERDPYAASVLVARQNDGSLAPFPIWDDVRTFDGRPWRGAVDVVSGGFPCQDISVAGGGAGIDGARSGLWRHMARIVGEIRPRFVFVENSPALVGRGLGRVLGDLAALGYDARWGVLGAHHAGAPHFRDRVWVVANANGVREPQSQGSEQDERGWISDRGGEAGILADPMRKRCYEWSGDGEDHARLRKTLDGRAYYADGQRCEEHRLPGEDDEEHASARCDRWWAVEPDVGRVAHGVANRVDRIRALGNGQVPAVARLAWRTLTRR